jgi:hypothetical protein
LDEDKMNPLGSMIKQSRPARDLPATASWQSKCTIEGPQCFQRLNHLFARRKIGFGGLPEDFSRQWVVWINEGHDKFARAVACGPETAATSA